MSDVLGVANFAEDFYEDLHAKCVMAGNRYAVMDRYVCDQDDMTAHLVYLSISPAFAEVFDDSVTADIPRQSHAAMRISSRTMWRRTISGLGISK